MALRCLIYKIFNVNINRGSNADSEVVCTLLEHLHGYHFTASLDIPNDDHHYFYLCVM